MPIRIFVITFVYLWMTASSAVTAANAIGDSGGMQGKGAKHADCIDCKKGEWQIARGKRNPSDQGRER